MAKYNNVPLQFTVQGKPKVVTDDGTTYNYHINALGEAAGKLNLAGLRVYLYVIHNNNDYCWTYNSTGYKNWLAVDKLHSADVSLKNGLENLVANGYARADKEKAGHYYFSETPRTDWIEELKQSQIVTKKSQVVINQSQIVSSQETQKPLWNF